MGKYIRNLSPGFTLVEVITVIALLGIVLAVAVPSINSTLNEMKLDSAAQEVVSAIHYVRSLAIKEGVVYGVKFTAGANKFNCYKTGSIINPFDKKPYVVDFDTEGHLQGVDIVSASFSAGKLTFDSIGEASESGTVLLEYAGLQKTITVSAPIGRVTVN